MPTSVRIALVCLVGLLVVMLLGLLAFAVLWRRRSAGPRAPAVAPTPSPAPRAALDDRSAAMATSASVRGALGSLEGVAVEAVTGAVTGAVTASQACPTCRREFDGGLVFCPHDARRLVPAGNAEGARSGGSVCPRCRRAFDSGRSLLPARRLGAGAAELIRGDARRPAAHGAHRDSCQDLPQLQETLQFGRDLLRRGRLGAADD